MKYMGGYGILLVVLFGIFFGVSKDSHAASLYIDPILVDVLKADTVTVAVRVDTDEGECINTVDAVITYDDTIHAIDVSRGRSILSLWVEEPVINNNARTITFAGGIPNGYCGRIPGDPSLTNIIVELVFRAPGFSVGRPDSVDAGISFAPETRVLLNDGLGTQAPLRTIGGTINLLQQVGTTTNDSWTIRVQNDETPPAPFGVELVQNSAVFSGKYYIVFNTQDKQSGIDHYEAIEESREDLYRFLWGRADAPWSRVKSPYVLKDQSLNSVIRVKAVDKAGNERITVLVPDETLRSNLLLVPLLAVSVIVLIVVGVIGYFSWRRLRKRSSIEKENVHESNDM